MYIHTNTHRYTRLTTANTSNAIGCNIDNCPALPVDPPGEASGVLCIMVVVVEVVVAITCVVEVGDTIVEMLSVTIPTGCEVVTQITSPQWRLAYLQH